MRYSETCNFPWLRVIENRAFYRVGSNEPTFSCKKGSSLFCITIVALTNSYGHPHEATLRRLQAADAKVLRTDELGQIRISVDK